MDFGIGSVNDLRSGNPPIQVDRQAQSNSLNQLFKKVLPHERDQKNSAPLPFNRHILSETDKEEFKALMNYIGTGC